MKISPQKNLKKSAPKKSAGGRGGARPGAGRKKGGKNAQKKAPSETSKNIPFSFKLSKINSEKLKKMSEFLQEKPQKILTDFIENFEFES